MSADPLRAGSVKGRRDIFDIKQSTSVSHNQGKWSGECSLIFIEQEKRSVYSNSCLGSHI